MKIEETTSSFDYSIDVGKLMQIIEFSDYGIDKVDDFVLEKIKGYNNIGFKGRIREKDIFTKLVNKIIKLNPAVSIYIYVNKQDIIALKNVNNIIYTIEMNTLINYSEKFINFYMLKNTRFIIKKRFINKLIPLYSIQKSKTYILLESLNKEDLNYCYLNGYNFTYSFDMIREILEGKE